MKQRLAVLHIAGILFCCLFIFALRPSPVLQAEPDQRPTIFVSVTPILVTVTVTPSGGSPTNGPKTGCGKCSPADLAALRQRVAQGSPVEVSISGDAWSAQLDNLPTSDNPVTIVMLRPLETVGYVDVAAEGLLDPALNGSLTVNGVLPALAPGGDYIGVACTLDDCSAENILANLDSPNVAVWAIPHTNLVNVEAVHAPQPEAPAFRFDYSLAEEVSDAALSIEVMRNDGAVIIPANHPLGNLTAPYILHEDGSVVFYEPGAYLLEQVNTALGTQFAAPSAIDDYRFDLAIDGIYETSVDVTADNVP